ncbi:putative protein TPRXL [Lytechinus variegatus]|uniref:putative protein TPRXL n=1 Tax=Lytechinus variegatus TaxID=7654 RepID=UPI001BB23224|nr:putative protein TPRXL [Lytechinus variegatus]XP_041474842.1 putative protein TPRXL [Lytechinus variegatus]
MALSSNARSYRDPQSSSSIDALSIVDGSLSRSKRESPKSRDSQSQSTRPKDNSYHATNSVEPHPRSDKSNPPKKISDTRPLPSKQPGPQQYSADPASLISSPTSAKDLASQMYSPGPPPFDKRYPRETNPARLRNSFLYSRPTDDPTSGTPRISSHHSMTKSGYRQSNQLSKSSTSLPTINVYELF